MKKLLLAAVIVLALGLAASIYFCFTLSQDKNDLTAELNSVKTDLASVQAELAGKNDALAASLTELDATKATLTSTTSELSTTKDTLVSTQSDLTAANRRLETTQTELNSANNQLTSSQASLTTLQDSVSGLQHQLDISRETLDGLGITVSLSRECRDVALVDNATAQNPTWNELMSFLANDSTEDHEYIADVYDCSQFSRDLHNRAEAAGIRAAEVQVRFKGDRAGHALDAFITTDFGLVYVDCTTPPDTCARVVLDKEYRAVNKERLAGQYARDELWWDSLWSYYYLKSDSGGHAVVSSIRIYW